MPPCCQRNSHKYLIETNPAFAVLGNFLNSDYLLDQLGFDPDQAQKRLGDGLYEQRLIREAIVARIEAGRDVVIASQREEDSYSYQRRRETGSQYQVTQHASELQVGGDLAISAGRDMGIIASRVEAAGDISLQATENLVVAAAANESYEESYRKHAGKKTQRIDSSVSQQQAEIEAGGSLVAVSGSDMTLVASDLRSGDEAFFYAGGELSLLAEQNSDYSLYDMQKKGSWGSKKTQRDEVTTVRNVGTRITSGGDLTLVSEGDQLYQRARLDSGADLTLESGGAITFEAVKDLDQESHEKSKSSSMWTSAKGKGTTDETLLQSQMIAQGDIVIKAVDGLNIDIKQVNQQTVSQTIDAMVQADPSLEWIKQAELRGDVDWRQVKEIHDSFKYSHSGLGAGAQLIIAIVMAAVVGPMAAGALGGAATGAAATSLATTGVISTINNKGNLGAAFKETFSSDSSKNAAVAGVAAGLTEGLYDGMLNTKTNSITGKVTVDLSNLEGIGRFAGNQALQSGTSAALNKALGRDVDFKDALQSALFNTLAAATFNAVGDHTQGVLDDGSLGKVAVHALVGGLLSEATGGDFATGALAAGANEALVGQLNDLVKGDENLLLMMSQLVGVAAAAVTDGDMENAAWVTKNATQYNFMGHQELDELVADAQVCEARGNCDEVRQKFRDISVSGDDALGAHCATDPAGCVELYGDLLHERLSVQDRISKLYFDDSIPSIIKRDLHVYQMQNMSAIGTLTQAEIQVGLESQGLSSSSAQLGAKVAAAAASGGLVIRTGGANGASSAATPSGAIWSSTKSKSAVENALGHWNKHKSEFPELQNAKQYAEQAKKFLTNPPQGTLTKTNARGDTLRYDPSTNTFGVLGQDGAPRTMFRPIDGIIYWNRQ